MTDERRHVTETGPTHRGAETAVCLLMVVFGIIVIMGSLQVGINWGVEGPKAGFFPFYLGVIIIGSSIFNLLQNMSTDGRKIFASWGQLRQVLSVVVPTAIYVLVITIVGIYLSSMVLIAVFMKWLGRYPWLLVLAIAIGVPVIFYLMFERWFLVPLPKGPIEEWLNL